MRYQFPYADLAPITIPDENLLGVFESGLVQPDRPAADIVAHSLARPIATQRLRDVARGARRVLIIPDDVTRLTPAHQIIPQVLAELHLAGVADEGISFLMSLGTHRDMMPAEIAQKIGADIAARYPAYNHRWDREEELYFAGTTAHGLDVWPNRMLRQADLVIGIGCIMPHAVAGFSGGGKIIVPGVCGEKTAGAMHWFMAGVPTAQIYGQAENPVRQAIDEVAESAGLRFICDVVMNNEGEIVALVSGHPVAAHRAGCRISRAVHGVRLPGQADIVIIDSYRTDIDYWQAIKAMTPADLVVKNGGVVIHVASCPEGVAQHHPEVLQYGYQSVKRTLEMEAAGAINKSVAMHMLQASRVIVDRASGYLVSPNISREDTLRLNFRWAATAQVALDEALARLGPQATIAVLRQAGDLLPLLPGTD